MMTMTTMTKEGQISVAEAAWLCCDAERDPHHWASRRDWARSKRAGGVVAVTLACVCVVDRALQRVG